MLTLLTHDLSRILIGTNMIILGTHYECSCTEQKEVPSRFVIGTSNDH